MTDECYSYKSKPITGNQTYEQETLNAVQQTCMHLSNEIKSNKYSKK